MNGILFVVVSLGFGVFAAAIGQDSGTTDECSSTSSKHESEERIVGGIVAADHSRPWMVYLYSDSKSTTCGGALIRPQWVLTAAHCVSDGSLYTAVAGTNIRCTVKNNTTYKFFGKAERQNVNMSYLRCWNNRTYKDDIALLKLDRPFSINKNIKTIPLASREYQPGEKLEISGWGLTSEGSLDYECNMRTVELPVVSKTDCKTRFSPLFNGQVCAGYNNGLKGTCIGDSGGPLVELTGDSAILVGIASYGKHYCESYGVFTKVDFYSRWIEEILDNET